MDTFENNIPEEKINGPVAEQEENNQMLPEETMGTDELLPEETLGTDEMLPEEEESTDEMLPELDLTEEDFSSVEDTFVKEAYEEKPPVYTPPTPFADSVYVQQVPERKTQQQQDTYFTAGRVSPYDNSPYVVAVPPKVKAKRKKRKTGFWKTLLSAVLVIALVAGACAATAVMVNDYWDDRLDAVETLFESKLEALEKEIAEVGSGSTVTIVPGASQSGGLSPAQVYAMNVNSVVMIYNEVTGSYFGQTGTGISTGSGFIISEDGYVVTNYHVVEGDGKLTVITGANQEYKAKLIGFDDTNDVALLKIEAQGLTPVALGKSSDLIVGDQVVAIGNPLGELTSTLTVGYISAMERDVSTDGFAINMLQTDAAINSGNSGGPLFNMKGEVVGITTAKYSGTSSSGATIEGVGFAIPIDDVKSILSDLINYGYITGAYLGVSVTDMDPATANYYGMPVGAYVVEVVEGGCAQKAGLRPKDIIVGIGSIRIENVNDLTRALRNFHGGDRTVIIVYRGGRELKLAIVLEEKPVSNQTQETP